RAPGVGSCVLLSSALILNGQEKEAERRPAPAPAINLGGADGFLTFVATDTPIYRPGEKLYVRATLLHANKDTPANDTTPALMEVTGPKGDTVASGFANPQDSVFGFSWDIPAGTAGGEYTVKVSHPYSRH